MVGSINADERAALKQERERLYQQVVDKDEEINQQSQDVEKFKEQIMDQEELIANTRRDYENLLVEMTRIHQENESAKEDVKEVLKKQALLNSAQSASGTLQEPEILRAIVECGFEHPSEDQHGYLPQGPQVVLRFQHFRSVLNGRVRVGHAAAAGTDRERSKDVANVPHLRVGLPDLEGVRALFQVHD